MASRGGVGVGARCSCARAVDSVTKAAYASFGHDHVPRSATVRSDAIRGRFAVEPPPISWTRK